MTKHLPGIPADKRGSLLKQAWEELYIERHGTGDVKTWAIGQAKTEWMKQEIERVFNPGKEFVMIDGEFKEVKSGARGCV